MKGKIDPFKQSPDKLHKLGSNAREKDDLNSALLFLDQAILGYQKESNYGGLVDALKDRFLTWKHYFLNTDDVMFAILARKDAEAMLAISQDKGLSDKLSTSYFRLGEVMMLFEDFQSAVKFYKKSLKYYSGSLSEKGDYRYHLGEALYKNNQKKKGVKEMLKGLSEIKRGASEVQDFLIHVWESGCHLRLAELLIKDNPHKARQHLLKAKKIVDSDKKLVIRKRQLKELFKIFKS